MSEVRLLHSRRNEFPRFWFTEHRDGGSSGVGATKLRSPAGIRIGLTGGTPHAVDTDVSSFLMNHVAIHVPDVGRERVWFETILGSCTVLERERAWEPVTRSYWPDVHLFRFPDFYITLRGGFPRAFVDHVGWMVDAPDRVEAVAEVLRRIGWPVLFGPEEVDGSYLVHFHGPDGRVHDFFYPTSSVLPRQADP
ncbi:MAG TPA: hypothetical protein VF263_13275 [Longimicrobiaceae bacterium]